MSGSINQLFNLAPWQSAASQPNSMFGWNLSNAGPSDWPTMAMQPPGTTQPANQQSTAADANTGMWGLPFMTLLQFAPQQVQDQIAQSGTISPELQQQMAMYWAGIGRPNTGGDGPGGDQGAAGQGY